MGSAALDPAIPALATRHVTPTTALDALLRSCAIGEREHAAGVAYGALRLRFEEACRSARRGGAGAMSQPAWFDLKRRYGALMRAAPAWVLAWRLCRNRR